MATITMTKVDGGSGGSLELSDAVFNAEVNERVVRIALNQFQANQRSGTHSTKTRTTISGGGRKPWKQKGTGRARQGSTRSPQWRHGAVAHGPHPRDYSYSINRKEKRAALTSLLSSHASEGTLTVAEDFSFGEVKTSAFVSALKSMGVWESRQLLIITAETDEKLLLSSRNVGHVKVINADNLNIYDLITAYQVVMTREAAEAIDKRLSADIRTKNNEEAA